MTNALIILILMAVVLVLIAFIISKSSLAENDKVMSLIVILVVFSLVAILNESKRSQTARNMIMNLSNFTNETQIFSGKALEKMFFEFPKDKTMPQVNKTALNFSGYFARDYPRFLVIFGPGKVGKTTEILLFISELHKTGTPALYLDCKGVPLSVSRFSESLAIQNLYIVDDSLERMNRMGKTPFIIIDNFAGFLDEGCELCGFLAYLYERRLVNILILTNKGFLQEELMTEGFLVKIAEKEEIGIGEPWIMEVIEEINVKNASSRRITESDAKKCLEIIDLDYAILLEYEKNAKEFESFEIFCRRKAQKIYEETVRDNFKGFLQVFAKLAVDPNGKHSFEKAISYGELKAQKIERLDEIIDELIRADILDAQNGKYKIRKRAILTVLSSP